MSGAAGLDDRPALPPDEPQSRINGRPPQRRPTVHLPLGAPTSPAAPPPTPPYHQPPQTSPAATPAPVSAPQPAALPVLAPLPTAAPPDAMSAQPVNPAALGLGTVIPVIGAHPYAGASGVALAVADAAAALGLRVLLIDCADPVRTGLAGVCTAEGASVPVADGSGSIRVSFRQLDRGGVQMRRLVPASAAPITAQQIPPPHVWAGIAPSGVDVTVVDLGWDPWLLLARLSTLGPAWWLAGDPAQLAPVLVMRPTMSSAAKAEGTLTRYAAGVQHRLLAPISQVAVVGGETFPPQVLAAAGPMTQRAVQRAVFFPWSTDREIPGWTTDATPGPLIAAGTQLLRGAGGRLAAAAGPPPPSSRRRGLFRKADPH